MHVCSQLLLMTQTKAAYMHKTSQLAISLAGCLPKGVLYAEVSLSCAQSVDMSHGASDPHSDQHAF